MVIVLRDYRNVETSFDIGDVNDIGAIYLSEVTGDEKATVIYKDYRYAEFDCGCGRLFDYPSGMGFIVYNSLTGYFDTEFFTRGNAKVEDIPWYAEKYGEGY